MPTHAPFGTAHEQLEDEQNSAVSRRPKRVEEEFVTDEKGRRRFHGAFTGGFSAGYFNSVGSKEGWQPQTFKSTRQERSERMEFTAKDFMDDEDRGEFGFAATKIRVRNDFMDKVSNNASVSQQNSTLLAWERAGPSTSSVPRDDFNELVAHLERTVRPVNDSIGVKMLKQMGWREGKGIGPRMKRRALEKQKVADARARGESLRFNEKAVRDIEEFAPETEFAPDDIPRMFLEQNDAQHGIGYKPLEHSNVLNESFNMKVNSLKTKLKSKGIRGKAFGVGAFEDDDEDIYTVEDLSKYDYAIGGNNVEKEVERYDSNFIPATDQERPVIYHAPHPTKHFNPRHRPEPITLRNLPPAMLTATSHLTPLQKAVFLGDRSASVMELLNDEDRKKLELLTRKSEKEVQIKKEKVEVKKTDPLPFEEEPLKAHRFKKYVHYLKSGWDMQPPLELTRLEWERELAEFQAHLSPELRAMLPAVQARQAPLANLKTAQPIANLLKSRFQTETSTDIAKVESKITDERKQAVKDKRFGPLTRTVYKWHPSKLLCKFMNVEDPYPESQMVGTLDMQKSIARPDVSGQLGLLTNLGLPNTQQDVMDRLAREAKERQAKPPRKSRFDEDYVKEMKDDDTRKFNIIEKPVFVPPIELLQSVFELPDAEVSSTSTSEDEGPTFSSLIDKLKQKEAITKKPLENMITINDLVPDDDEFGPRIPESFTTVIPLEEKIKIVPVAPCPLIQLSSSSDSETDYKPVKKHKRKDESHSRKRHKKEKKHKKHKKRSRDLE